MVYEGLGHIGKTTFTVGPGVTPVHHAPGRIKVALHKDVKANIEELEKRKETVMMPMPTLEEVLPKLSKAKVFTTLAARDEFYLISFDEQSSKLTTFWTPFGRYRYLRMPFGVNAAPEEFECKLHVHLSDLQCVEVLRDDILEIGSLSYLRP